MLRKRRAAVTKFYEGSSLFTLKRSENPTQPLSSTYPQGVDRTGSNLPLIIVRKEMKQNWEKQPHDYIQTRLYQPSILRLIF